MKILICVDGSKTADEAVHYAGELAEGLTAEVVLLYVERCYLCGLLPSLRKRIMHLRKKDSGSVLSKAEKILSGRNLKLLKKTRAGRVETEIVSEANEGDYDLVVIGSQGVKGIEMFFFGALSYKLIEGLKKPVLVVRKGRKKINKILVCTGGSEQASKAAKFAGKINNGVNARISLLHVADNDNTATSNQGIDAIRKTVKLLGDLGRKAETMLLYGPPSKKIIETVKRGNYDLVVLGTTGMNPMKLLFSGSVVYEVLKNVKVPCLIVK